MQTDISCIFNLIYFTISFSSACLLSRIYPVYEINLLFSPVHRGVDGKNISYFVKKFSY